MLDRNLISGVVSQWSWSRKQVAVESGGRLWVIYGDDQDYIKLGYSDNNGVDWTIMDGSYCSGKIPSLCLDPNNEDIHLVGSNNLYYVCLSYSRINHANGLHDINNERVGVGQDIKYNGIPFVIGSDVYIAFLKNSEGQWNYIDVYKRLDTNTWTSITSYYAGAGQRFDSFNICANSDNTIIHFVFCTVLIADSSKRDVKYMSFNGTSFSAVTTINDGSPNVYAVDPAICINQSNDDIWITWAQSGYGVNSSKSQVIYSVYTGESWSDPTNLTDENDNVETSYPCSNSSGVIYIFYSGRAADPLNPGILNIGYYYYTDSTWSDMILLTSQASHQYNAVPVVESIDVWWLQSGGNLYFGQMDEPPLGPYEYYVDLSGNDSTGDGSIGNPWRTVQYGVDNMSSGDTLYIGGGYFNETVTVPNFTSPTYLIGDPIIRQETIFTHDSTATGIYRIIPGEYCVIENIYTENDIYQLSDCTCVFVAAIDSGFSTDSTSVNCVCHHCLAYNNTGIGFDYDLAGNHSIRNCIAFSNSTYGFVIETGNVCTNNCAFDNDVGNFSGGATPGSGSIQTNPAFINIHISDFRLRPSSPCIDTGVDLGECGRVPPNIGIYQGDGVMGPVAHGSPQGLGTNMGVSFAATVASGRIRGTDLDNL